MKKSMFYALTVMVLCAGRLIFSTSANVKQLTKNGVCLGCDFMGDDLSNKTFEKVRANGADFGLTHLTSAIFKGPAQLRGAQFISAQANGANFSTADLSGADFFQVELLNANFDKANLSGADFNGAILKGATFNGAKLAGALFPSHWLDLLTPDQKKVVQVLT